MMSLETGKRGQSASATASLVIIIAGLIILYILFLPAPERKALLQDNYVSQGSGGYGQQQAQAGNSLAGVYLPNESVLDASPGRIDYLKIREYEHPIPAINLYAKTQATIIHEEDTLYIKNGLFDKLFRNTTFYVEDLENTENILLSMNLKRASGRLTIKLNGQIIYDSYVDKPTPDPITLDKRNLRDSNVLEFSVDEVGFAFWKTNEYEFTNIQITADVTDVSQQASRTTFTISDVEKFNLQRSTITFFPDCSPRDVGRLTITLNNQEVFSAVPDCGQINMVDFSPSILTAGSNKVSFKTERGDYLIYQINIKTELKEQAFPTYYFDLDPSLFYFTKEYKRDRYYREEVCGAVDGLCPQECTEDEDIDCCFEGQGKFWCDVEPDDKDLRCASVISAEKCGVCPAGYEDTEGRVAEECEDTCGDDRDGVCPTGCSVYYDKDCCFAQDEENFWCDDIPKFGLDNVCESSLTENECDDCPSGYESEGQSNACSATGATDSFVDAARLKPGIRIFLTFLFIDDKERKAANIYLNGHKFYLDTRSDYYEREITEYVEEDSNAVKLEPDQTTLDIRKIRVDMRTG